MQKRDVPIYEFELSIGDVITVGEHLLTIIDIDGLDVSFRIDSGDTSAEAEQHMMLIPR